MNDIITYKDSLKYRDEKIQSKINHESYLDVKQKTMQTLIQQKQAPRMTKANELKSDIGFWFNYCFINFNHTNIQIIDNIHIRYLKDKDYIYSNFWEELSG